MVGSTKTRGEPSDSSWRSTTTYGDSAADITAGLDALVTRQTVRVQPAFPLLVPVAIGLVLVLTVEDLLGWWALLTLG
ncbi:hypothetical protein [Halomarina oriensis]|uniref:Prepilin peptidase n=1 Tax=Halomarina oriensis TaxID=671145 RepID=A0A6B0GPH3_9EURY|nr:hypothetical protein [Halomarina oriensis]MWG35397.1 hypothetical protein [Halomarina oriensis]